MKHSETSNKDVRPEAQQCREIIEKRFEGANAELRSAESSEDGLRRRVRVQGC
jgi:hypothetical protein